MIENIFRAFPRCRIFQLIFPSYEKSSVLFMESKFAKKRCSKVLLSRIWPLQTEIYKRNRVRYGYPDKKQKLGVVCATTLEQSIEVLVPLANLL